MPRFVALAVVVFAVVGCAPSPFVEVRTLEDASSARHVRFNPAARFVAAISLEWDEVIVWNVDTGRRSRPQFATRPRTLAFSPDGTRLATAHPGYVRLTDLQTLKLDQVLFGWDVCEIDFVGDGSQLVGITDSTCRVWDIPTQRFTATRRFESIIATMHVAPDRKTVLIAEAGGSVSECDATTLAVRGTFMVPPERHVVFAPDGDQYSALHQFDVAAVPRRDAQFHRSLRPAGVVETVAYSPDGRCLAVSWGDDPRTITALTFLIGWRFPPPLGGGVTVWDLQEGREVGSFAVGRRVTGVAWSPDGSLIATVDSRGRARLWRPPTKP